MANPGMRHAFKSAKADPVDTTLVGATKWNDRHYFLEDDGTTAAGTLGDLPYRGADGLTTLLTGAAGVLTSAGSGNVPAWSMSPTLTSPTVTTIVIGAVTIDATDAGKIDGITNGTAAASKALVLDANKDLATLRNLTLSGNLAWANGTTLVEDAANILALRNGANEQAFRIGPSGNSSELATSSGQLLFKINGNSSAAWLINASGHLLANGAFNIGDGAGNSPVNGWFEGDLTVGDQLVVSGVGPHAIGGATAANIQWLQTGTFSGGTGGNNAAIGITTTLTVGAAMNGYGFFVGPTFSEAASGTHALLAGSYFATPSVTGGVATVTDTATIYVQGASSATVAGANYAIWSDGGINRFDGDIYRDTTKILGAQGAAVADASGGAIIDAEARTAINALLARLRTHGLIAT